LTFLADWGKNYSSGCAEAAAGFAQNGGTSMRSVSWAIAVSLNMILGLTACSSLARSVNVDVSFNGNKPVFSPASNPPADACSIKIDNGTNYIYIMNCDNASSITFNFVMAKSNGHAWKPKSGRYDDKSSYDSVSKKCKWSQTDQDLQTYTDPTNTKLWFNKSVPTGYYCIYYTLKARDSVNADVPIDPVASNRPSGAPIRIYSPVVGIATMVGILVVIAALLYYRSRGRARISV
jgi:hypothetical protein